MSILGHYLDRALGKQYWSDDFNHKVPGYLEQANNNANLIICYGDSWTWGDGVGHADSSKGIWDVESRSQQIYANQLAEKLQADWAVCAIPGIFNYWIHDRLTILLDNDIHRLSQQYKHIWIVVTLTEIGRDFEYPSYVEEFEKFYHIGPDQHEDILIQAEKFDFLKLNAIAQQLPSNVSLHVGRNFTDSFDQNQSLLSNLVPLTWSRIIFAAQGIAPVPQIHMMSFAINNFDRYITKRKLNSTVYKQWMNDEILPKSLQVLDLLNKSVYNKKTGSKHPTQQGHALWANYLYNFLYEQTKP